MNDTNCEASIDIHLNHTAVVTLDQGCVCVYNLLQCHFVLDKVSSGVHHMLHNLLEINLQVQVALHYSLELRDR